MALSPLEMSLPPNECSWGWQGPQCLCQAGRRVVPPTMPLGLQCYQLGVITNLGGAPTCPTPTLPLHPSGLSVPTCQTTEGCWLWVY